jgi:hypothetical protein
VLDTIEPVRAGSARPTALHGLPPRARRYGGDDKRTALAGKLPPTEISQLMRTVCATASWSASRVAPGAGTALALDVQ